MLKINRLKTISIWLFLLLGSAQASAQQRGSNVCHIVIDGKIIPIFGDLSSVKKVIPFHEDIDYINGSKAAYYYDANIVKTKSYVLTPQVVIIANRNGTRKIVKQSVNYLWERSKKDGPITKRSLNEIIKVIKSHCPFLDDVSMDMGTEKCTIFLWKV